MSIEEDEDRGLPLDDGADDLELLRPEADKLEAAGMLLVFEALEEEASGAVALPGASMTTICPPRIANSARGLSCQTDTYQRYQPSRR